LAGGLLILLVGLADDIFCLSPAVKLLFQATVATATVLGSDLTAGWGVPWGILWVVTLTNAHNFIDGMDGLFAGCGAIECVALAVAFLLTGHLEAAYLPLLLLAACMGFFCFNRYPAKIFAGDCGSGTVGFLLGMFSLGLFDTPMLDIRILAPFLIFAYPLTDLFTAVLRRTLRGKNPFSADRGHLHHRLSAVGLMQPQCVRVLHAISAALAIVGILLEGEGLLLWASAACICVVFLMMGIRRFILGFS
jgi:UDP-GlcNAc:undecaprenyl-phosphate GlcNAc-1-phosphate transferase